MKVCLGMKNWQKVDCFRNLSSLCSKSATVSQEGRIYYNVNIVSSQCSHIIQKVSSYNIANFRAKNQFYNLQLWFLPFLFNQKFKYVFEIFSTQIRKTYGNSSETFRCFFKTLWWVSLCALHYVAGLGLKFPSSSP